ncbi:MAG: hypothetical protein JXA57_13965 [Armatimonadetes bacterium]|nr:hypothetical protein [Armatimonadota bacterium]
MLDFSRVTDFLADLAGGVVQDRLTEPSGLMDLLQNAGLDPGGLANLSEGDLAALLAEHGIDPTQILPTELHELLAGLGIGEDGSSPPGTG